MANIAFKKALPDPQLTRQMLENRTRYIWYPGPANKGCIDFCPADTNIGISTLPRGQVVQITTHRYCARDTDDRGTPNAERLPFVKGQHEDGVLVMLPLRAGQITDWLERRLGQKGLVVLEELIDQPEERVALIINALITEQDDNILRNMTLSELRNMIEAGRNKFLKSPDISSTFRSLLEATSSRMFEGIARAEQFILNELMTLKAEMTQRRVANGTGIVSLPPTVLAMLPLVDKQAGEYQLDSEEMQRNLFQMMGQKFTGNTGGSPEQTAEIIGSVISAVLGQLGLVPKANTPVAPTPAPVEPPKAGKK